MGNKTTNTKSNFGKMGWVMIIYLGIILYICPVLTGDGFNTLIPQFAQHGMNPTEMLSFVTVAQWIAIFVAFLSVFLIRKFGPRNVTTISMILIGVLAIVWGRTTTIVLWAAVLCLMQIFVQIASANSGMSLAAYWFPTRKGLALGWATMGSNLASATCIYLLTFLFKTFGGLSGGLTAFGVAVIVFAIVGHLIIRDTPEELGLTPDNLPMTREELEASKAKFENATPTKVTVLLRKKELWLDAIIFGLLGMVTAGLVSQMVPGLTSMGIEEDRATLLFSATAFIGLVGSYLWGWLDQKLGTRMATFWFGLSYGLGALLLVLVQPLGWTLWPALILIAGGIGGYVNLMPSMCATIFGRRDFVQAYAVASVITGVIRASVFTILGFALAQCGSYVYAYGLLAFLGVVAAFLCLPLKESSFKMYQENNM